MIAQNSEVYNPPTYLFSLYTYMEKDLCRGIVYFTVLCDHPYLVSLLLPFWYPYILLQFNFFLLLVEYHEGAHIHTHLDNLPSGVDQSFWSSDRMHSAPAADSPTHKSRTGGNKLISRWGPVDQQVGRADQ